MEHILEAVEARLASDGFLPVRMTTEIEPAGVRYRVLAGRWPQWEKFVAFSKGRGRFTPGGRAFVAAAKEQAVWARKVADHIALGRAIAIRFAQGR